jgi:hypothetical protein
MKEYPHIQYHYLMSRIAKNRLCHGYYFKYVDINPANKITLEEDEEFKNMGIINSYDYSDYEISNYGKIKNIVLKNYVINHVIKNYYHTNLSDKVTHKRTLYSTHRLIAQLFIPNDDKSKNVVNHLDNNPLNNYYKNLEWTTIQGNTMHAISRKVKQIDPKTNEIIKIFDSISDAYKSFNRPCNSHISMCCLGKNKVITALGYKWEYV